MNLPRLIARRLRALFRRAKLDREMAEEMRAHVELQMQANLAAGMAPDEAAYAARRQFGGMEQIKEIARAQRAGRWLEDIVREMRHSVRMLVRQRGFTATALGTLALCVGANIAIFAVVDAVILRPLPFPEPDRLVSVFNTYPRAGLERSSTSFANYFDRRGAIRAFASAAIYQDIGIAVGNPGAPRQMPAARISPEFFSTLGVPLARGRMFTEAEMVPGSDQVAVLTDGFWRTQFNADPEVLGRAFLNDGRPVTVIGVLPRDFRFLSSHAEFFRPAAEKPDQRLPKERHNNNWTLVARLAPGATLAEAQAELDAFNEAQLRDDPFGELVKAAGYRSLVHPLHADHVEAVKPMLLLLQGGVLLLLLIGTVNLANLLLIRTSGRAKELAVRQALGATRWGLARAMAMETLLLALTGGLLGLGLGALGIRLLAVLGADHLPLGASIAFDGQIALLALAGSIGVGLLLAVPVMGFN
ncbi:MAG: ABC transporter permease, partial [Pseudomonadota bacterium]